MTEPTFIYFTADEGVGELECDRDQLIDHFRYLIADRHSDRARLVKLCQLRGDPVGEADVEHAPWLIEIYEHMIAWAKWAQPGDAINDSGYRAFCVGKEIKYRTQHERMNAISEFQR